ncbi:MAG TPA: OmpH family outer membrane protein [Terriglobales bacterium]|nr:OmpH family outer membrane protein [Terriglobales bacterium]
MNSKFAPFTLAVVILSVMALGQSSSAAPKPAADAPSIPASATSTMNKIGIINMQQAILASNEGQREFQALSKKFEPKQAELKNMNDDVEGLKKQLNTQGDKLNDVARANLVKSIESKQKELQRNLEDAQSDFQGQQNDILQRIGQKMMQVLDKYAKDNGYSLILDVSNQNSPVLWAGASTDVTKAIVEQYNTVSGVAAPPATPAANHGLPSAPRPAARKATAKPQ